MPRNKNHLLHELVVMMGTNRDDAYATQGDRYDMLLLCARQLYQIGFTQMHVEHIGLRHAFRLVALWKNQGISSGVIRNRLAGLRWWAKHVHRGHVFPAKNDIFGLEPRSTVATVSKAQTVEQTILDTISDTYIRSSVALQQAFGLRREECLKIIVWQADHGHVLIMQETWCKGGRYREIPIRTAEQRTLLDSIKAWLPSKASALIPPHLNYIQQRRRYDRLTREAGLHNLHGLRHHFAQTRLEEEAGHPAPLAGGPHRKDMTPEQRARDTQARLQVMEELGHSRLQIGPTYYGA